jgi:UTP pyrophosphatase
MKYLSHYPKDLQDKIQVLINNDKLSSYIKNKYPNAHSYTNDKALYSYVMDYKNEYFKKHQVSKVMYDGKINVINNALGMHSIVSRVQGGKLKSKNEIRVASVFKNMPEEFLQMIVVHELAHFKEKDHDKAFYNLCTFIMPTYHQIEFDLRVYLMHIDLKGKLY